MNEIRSIIGCGANAIHILREYRIKLSDVNKDWTCKDKDKDKDKDLIDNDFTYSYLLTYLLYRILGMI